MEQQTPIPPNQGWSCAKAKTRTSFSHPWFGGEVGGNCRLGRKQQKRRNILFSCKLLILKKLSIVYPDRSYSTNWEKKVFKGFSVLISMYSNDKSAVKIDNKLTQSFPCHFEVEQGWMLSPEFTPVPSQGSTFVTWYHNKMSPRREFTPVVVPEREFHSGTKSRNGIM